MDTDAPARRRLSGDLDNIVLTALRKEPQRRYASVEKFAEDIARHQQGLPVTARKGTLAYRATKFARRNWFLLGGLWLLQQKIIKWQIPAGMLGGLFLTALLFWRHRSNIANLVKGTEGRISFGKK